MRIALSVKLEYLRRIRTEPGPERVLASKESFRKLPLSVREWYRLRMRSGGRMPTELAARCLANDFRLAKYKRGGYKSVDGWRIVRKQQPRSIDEQRAA